MFSKCCQIVPALASAVHGASEELPQLPESPSPQVNRSRLASSTSSTTSPGLLNAYNLNSLRQTSQLDPRQAFKYFDKNHDGKLTIKEFKSVMHDLGYKTVDKRCIKQMFAEATRSANRRTLSYDEFVDFLESKLSLSASPPSPLPITTQDVVQTPNRSSFSQETNSSSSPKMQLDIETLFNCYDLDRNGFIEPKELRKVMKRLTGEKLSKRDIKEMINVADRNGDGLLDKTEFALLCSAF